MTAPLTAHQVESELRRLVHRLEDRTDALADLLQTAAEADVAYRLAYAKALLATEGGTVAEREAAATLAVETELRARKHSEAVADACREAVRSLRDQIGALQSLNANLRNATGLNA